MEQLNLNEFYWSYYYVCDKTVQSLKNNPRMFYQYYKDVQKMATLTYDVI